MDLNEAIEILKACCKEEYSSITGCNGCGLKNNCYDYPCNWVKPRYCYMENERKAIDVLKKYCDSIEDKELCTGCKFSKNCNLLPRDWEIIANLDEVKEAVKTIDDKNINLDRMLKLLDKADELLDRIIARNKDSKE